MVVLMIMHKTSRRHPKKIKCKKLCVMSCLYERMELYEKKEVEPRISCSRPSLVV